MFRSIAMTKPAEMTTLVQDASADVRRVKQIVAEHYGVMVEVLDGLSHDRKSMLRRQVAHYAAAELTRASIRDIAAVFKRSKECVAHSRKCVAALIRTSPEVASRVAEIFSRCAEVGIRPTGRERPGRKPGSHISPEMRARLSEAGKMGGRPVVSPTNPGLAELYRILSRKVGATEARRIIADEKLRLKL